MIAMLNGTVAHIGLKDLIVDVNGVGYLVSASTRTLTKIGSVGEHVKLLVDTHVREDQISLFGFIDNEEKEWFKRLCTVQGVGAKVCLAILSVLPPELMPAAIASQDKAAFTQADGVGPKLGLRIVTELKDKVAKLAISASVTTSAKTAGIAPVISNNNDAISALINLGYGRTEAFSAVNTAAKEIDNDKPSVEQLIQISLKSLSI